jgi:hypothetical protein
MNAFAVKPLIFLAFLDWLLYVWLLNPILHTVWLDNRALTSKIFKAKKYLGENSNSMHVFITFCPERRKTKVKFKKFLSRIEEN